MRYIVIVGIALIAGFLIRKKSKYRNHILFTAGILMILMSAFYNIRTLGRLLEFVRPLNQAFYQNRYLDSGSYPDSLLMTLLEGKTVYVKDDAYMIEEAEAHGKNFNYALYHARNEYYLLEYLNTELVKDASMNDVFLPEERVGSDFESLGQINDMLRYCFLYGDLLYESADYFAYYWYYYEYLDEIKAYLCKETDRNGETVFTSDELVMFWNVYEDREEEDLYIMTRDYYESMIGGEKEEVRDE